MALVVLGFYFLVLDQQTQESILQQLLLLLHLKRSGESDYLCYKLPFTRQGVLDQTCAVVAEKPILVRKSIKRNFVKEWWKENLKISRRRFET